MKLDDYNAFCKNLPHTTHVVQWGGAHVWKVAGKKVFVIGGWQNDDETGSADIFVTFKTSDISYDLLKTKPGCRPAPYLASRGMKWIQRTSDETLSDSDLKDYIAESHRLASLNLTKKLQKELGLNQD